MIVLIHTCGTDGVVALADQERVVAEVNLPGRSASEQIIPALRGLLAEGSAVEAIGVVHGPGSFTGVRVGLSAAKGLCDARGAGMMAMSRLQLVALQAREERVAAVLDAGRGEFYCGTYRSGVLEAEEILTRDALIALSAQREVVTCEPRVHAVLSQEVALTLIAEPGAREMLRLMQARMARGEWSDAATIDANYLRRTDAELLAETK